jgi:eukaryotic-like serine/threonine-protein kinase
MSSQIGQHFGSYEIIALLGKGGMGEVYRARDTKLKREVAIKILPDEFSRDPDRVSRFEREAEVLASLNHPNIAAIYDLQEANGSRFLVLELVEGETLAERIKRGPIPVDESLSIAKNICEALEAAHEKGVVHRDLKPANVKITTDGKVKVLDFGLAKAFEAEASNSNLSQSPTLTMAATQQGVLLGTAAYMSPEQVRGETVDKRADLWAFGCVLFEMLTGRGSFDGQTISDVLASVLKTDPDWNTLPQNLHPRIRLLLERCLTKDAKNRYHSIADARIDIQAVLADPRGLWAPPDVSSRSKLRMVVPWAVVSAIVSSIAVGLAVWNFRPSALRPITRFQQDLVELQRFRRIGRPVMAFSRDGSKFVYNTVDGLYLRSMEQTDAQLIAGTEEDLSSPFFSPDGQSIGYWSASSNQLKRIAVNGGAPVTLCNATNPISVNWGTDRTILFGQPEGIMRIPASGGTPELTVKAGEGNFVYGGELLPGGEWVMFTLTTTSTRLDNQGEIVVQSLKSGERKVLTRGGDARYVPTGHLVYALENTLVAVRFDLDSLQIVGGPVPILENLVRARLNPADFSPSTTGFFGPSNYGFSDNGTLVYLSGGSQLGQRRTLVWVDRHGREEPLKTPARAYTYVRLSPDGSRVAVDIRDQQNDIWIWDLTRETLARFTVDSGLNRGPVWTPDGKRIAFSAERDGAENIYWQAADGSGAPEPLTSTRNISIQPTGFSPDGKVLLVGGNAPPYGVSVAEVGARDLDPLFEDSFQENNGVISPDGKWLAYQSDESGRFEIYVRPFPDINREKHLISNGGGTRPLWSRNGRELFYLSFSQPAPLLGAVMGVPVETGTTFRAGTAKTIVQGNYIAANAGRTYDVSPDGQRFLMIKLAPEAEADLNPRPLQMNVVLNWLEELKQRVPTN